jgi:hypothetical protein
MLPLPYGLIVFLLNLTPKKVFADKLIVCFVKNLRSFGSLPKPFMGWPCANNESIQKGEGMFIG